MRIEFTVHGTPQPQGSSRSFIPKGWKRAVITSDNKTLKPWRQDVAQMAAEAMAKQAAGIQPNVHTGPFEGPVRLEVHFYFARPKSLKKSVIQKTTKPDVDKLARSVADSLSGIVFKDDSQIVRLIASKQFAGNVLPEGAHIIVHTL